MLLDDFFSLTDPTDKDGLLQATLSLNQGHPIFAGHFPGQPVVPGVCMMLMVRAVLEASITGKPVNLIHADHAKFLTPIDPRVTPTITLELKYFPEGNEVKVVARLFNEATVFFKYQALFRIADQ